jgi:hypothetical protein
MLLVRFPIFGRPTASQPVIAADKRTAYPALNEDFTVIDGALASDFQECDLAALRSQRRYRGQQVLIILGSAAMTGLGGVQAVLPGQRWPGVLLGVIGIILAASSRVAKEGVALNQYLSERAKAERLRALHFQYLSRTGKYEGPDREIVLRRAVLAVRQGKELK